MNARFRLFVALMAACASASPFAQNVVDSGEGWKLYDNGRLYVEQGFKGVPAKHRAAVKSVSLPVGATEIGDEWFKDCTALTMVLNYEKLQRIGARAFMGCTAFENISSGNNALVLREELNEIGEEAFRGCTSLKSANVAFHDLRKLTKLGPRVFMGCTNLTNATLPPSVTAIPDGCFADCAKLDYSQVVSESVTTIGKEAFKNCQKRNVTLLLKAGVTSIGQSAFEGCTGVTKIRSLAPKPPTLGADAFKGVTPRDGLAVATDEAASTYAKAAGWDWFAKNSSVYHASEAGNSVGYNFYSTGRLTLMGVSGTRPQASEWARANTVSVDFGTSLSSVPAGWFKDFKKLRRVDWLDAQKRPTAVEADAFNGCTALEEVSLPAYMDKIGDRAFANCPRLAKVTAQCKADAVASGGKAFEGIAANAELWVRDTEQKRLFEAAGWGAWFKTIRTTTYTFSPETKEGGVTTIAAQSATQVSDVLDALGDERYRNADVKIPQRVEYEARSIDATATAESVAKTLPTVASVAHYGGTMSGNVVRNLGVTSAGLFNTIDKGGTVGNLSMEAATIHADPADTAAFKPKERGRESDTTFVCLVARRNRGTMRNVSFEGNVIVDESRAKGKTLAVCLVGENDGDTLSGFIYVEDVVTMDRAGNKKMIPIKQNLATGRNRQRNNTKVAVRNSGMTATAPSAEGDASKRLTGSEVEFSDREFADGTVADWLNHSDKGLTGTNTRYWAQGEKVPTPASDASHALYKIDYHVTDAEKSNLISAPVYANGGSEITLSYATKPRQIKMGDKVVTPQDGETKLTYEAGKALTVSWVATAIDEPRLDGPRIAVRGGAIEIVGADGMVKTLHTLAGTQVAETRGRRLAPARPGLYIVRVGRQSQIVPVK